MVSSQAEAALLATSCPCLLPKRMGQTPVIMADTHVVVWLTFDPERISRRAKAAIDEARNKSDGLAISDITLLELATLVKKGRIVWTSALNLFSRRLNPVSWFYRSRGGHACAPLRFPPDILKILPIESLGATALVEGLPLLTADREIRRSKALRAIW